MSANSPDRDQITVFTHVKTPNPPKVVILLEELGLKYKIIIKEMGDAAPNGMKHPDFLKINPNGRVPAIIDHTNDNLIVWESGAILLYLCQRFDKTGKFFGNNDKDKGEVWSWLMFQVSGMGPMQGQSNWFRNFHSVKNLDQSVYDRYLNETHRVYDVLEKHLADTGRQWIALNRFTIADMAFYPWLKIYEMAGVEMNRFPKIRDYVARISQLPSVKATYAKLEPET